MIVATVLVGAFTLLPSIALAAPADTRGSKHTAFLARCAPNDCPIGLCDPGDFNIYGAAYFTGGPPTGTTASATTFAQASNARWEGATRSLTFSRYGVFSVNIDAKAATYQPGEIAGSATLGAKANAPDAEQFICFKDGTTKFRTTSDGDAYTCTAAYYCPSIQV